MLHRTPLFVLKGVLVVAGAALLGGCGGYSDGGGHYAYGDRGHDYRSSDYRSGDYATYREDVNKSRGDRNTVISDKIDDGRVNGSARSYEERKASRAADEGVPGARHEERELRDQRLDGR